jgi:hypothetical protein
MGVMISRRLLVLVSLLLLPACESTPVDTLDDQGTPGGKGEAVASLVLVGGAGRLKQARLAFSRVGLIAGEVDASLKEGALSIDIAALPPAGEVILEGVKLTGQSSYSALRLDVAAACVEFEDATGESIVLTSAPAFGACGSANGALRFDTGSLILPFPEGTRFETTLGSRVLLEIDASESVRFDEGVQAWRFLPSLRALPETAAAEFVVHVAIPPGSDRIAADYEISLASERSTARTRGRPDSAGRLIFGFMWPGLYAAHVSSPDGARVQVDGLLPETLRLGAPESSDITISRVDDGSRVVSSGLVFVSGNRSGRDPINVSTTVPDFAVAAGETLILALREVGRPDSGCPEQDDCLSLVWAGQTTLPNRVQAPAGGLIFGLTAGDGLLRSGMESSDATPVGLGAVAREWSVVLDAALPSRGELGLELSVQNLNTQTRLLSWELRVVGS